MGIICDRLTATVTELERLTCTTPDTDVEHLYVATACSRMSRILRQLASTGSDPVAAWAVEWVVCEIQDVYNVVSDTLLLYALTDAVCAAQGHTGAPDEL